jgi:hemerythrin-like metal-binding protein
MFIHWQPAFETGQTIIDAEHRMLLFLFRKMDVAIKTGVPAATLHDIVSELGRFVRFHFTSEENLMKETAYPRLAEHAAQHEELLVKLDSVAHKVAKGSELPEDMLYFLNEWLSEHIARHDQHIARHLRQAGQRPIAEFAYGEYLTQPASSPRPPET